VGSACHETQFAVAYAAHHDINVTDAPHETPVGVCHRVDKQIHGTVKRADVLPAARGWLRVECGGAFVQGVDGVVVEQFSHTRLPC
jgi:hypothetical protein